MKTHYDIIIAGAGGIAEAAGLMKPISLLVVQ